MDHDPKEPDHGSQITDHESGPWSCGLRVVHSNSRLAAMPLAQVDERNWSPVPAVARMASQLAQLYISEDRAKNF